MNNKTFAGPDGIPVETLKADASMFTNMTYGIVDKILRKTRHRRNGKKDILSTFNNSNSYIVHTNLNVLR